MTDAVLVLAVAGALWGARLPWRLAVRRRLDSIGPSPRKDRDGEASARTDRRTSDVVLVLDLLDVAVGAGAGVPRALEEVGRAVGGIEDAALSEVAVGLMLGASWQEAWRDTPGALGSVAECLEAAWVHGAAPGPTLRSRAAAIRRERRRDGREAAGRLGVHLVLPLGLCFLPAFVLLGLVPVLVSLADGIVG